MNIAYLMNTYPLTSTTFIRREIEALEELGFDIQRYAVRRWSEKLVDSLDINEANKTSYLLSGNFRALLWSLAKEIVINPRGFLRGLRAAFELFWNARGKPIHHVAYMLEAIYFRQSAKAQNVSHVHVHFATNATSVAMLSRLMGGPSYSFTVHGPDEFVEPSKLSFGSKIHYAAFVVAISEFCKRRLAQLGKAAHEDKIIIARCGIPLEEFEPGPECSSDNQTFVCVGRLCPQKGQLLIPKAASALRSDFPELKVILIGDGESRAAIEEEIAKYNVGQIVQLRGWIANNEVREIIRASRVVLLPSFAEGLPIVLMEALALGRPVISTIVAGIPELVDASCGWLIPPGDEDALVAAMRGALESNPIELDRKGKQGRLRVKQNHDRKQLASKLHENFMKLSSQAALQFPNHSHHGAQHRYSV